MFRNDFKPLYMALALFSPVATAQVIYGYEQARHIVDTSPAKKYYIQMGAYSTKSRADIFAQKLRADSVHSVSVVQHGRVYSVRIGPLSAEQARQMAQPLTHKTASVDAPKNGIHSVPNQSRPLNTKSSWYVSASLGGQRAKAISQMLVPNGSDFPAPYENDIYTTRTPSAMLAGVGAGYRLTSTRFPAVWFGVEYLHQFDSQVGKEIIQYSSPEFTNYNYRWNVESDLYLLSSKLNLVRMSRLMPYVKASAGVAINRANGYIETALSNVTPRISPAFGAHTKSDFTYRFGAGFDWNLKKNWLMSLGYEYADLGSFSSTNGIGTWSGASLASNQLTSNAVVAGVSYLYHG